MFKLESFTSALARHGAQVTYYEGDLQQAYADGVAEGQARSEDEQMRNLKAGLTRLASALSDDAQRRDALRQEAVAALSPIIDAIIEGLAPAAESQRLEEALRGELVRLAQMATPLRASIACSDRLQALVERCLAESGIKGIDLTISDSDKISLSLQGGRIEFAPDKTAQDIRALIAELKEEDKPWTQ
ncbi:hypothetical protein [Paracoccus salsus]|uniref:hypothetical protein n=1 Tax=Paracoccus salsus TaxID=2911061 RepID=UPI001F331D6C|nr:hypothetical protein [Paracoccus salsus]